MSGTQVVAEVSHEKVTVKDRAYRLQYRYKNRFGLGNGKVQEKVFWFKGDLKDAIIRVRKHCGVMDYTYIYCSPFIVDLDSQEELKSKDVDGSDEENY